MNPLSQKHGSRVIDSDMAKELLPEYDNGRGAKMVHEESSAVRDRVYDEAVARGENFVLATVGADIGKIEGYIDGLHDAGYTVGLHYVDVTPKQAAQRMLSRFLPDGTPSGRYTPPDVLLSAGNFPQDTYNRLLTRGVADEYAYEYASDLAKVHTTSAYSPSSKWVEKLYDYEQSGGDAAEYLMLRGMTQVSGKSLTETVLDSSISGIEDTERAQIIFLETTMPESFTDPYTKGHEYILDTDQQRVFSETYFADLQRSFLELTASQEYGAADVASRYELVKDLKADVNARTKREISNWLYSQGISPTKKP